MLGSKNPRRHALPTISPAGAIAGQGVAPNLTSMRDILFPMRRRVTHIQVGFTLVEVLVVIGIISLLIGLLVPAMASFKAQSHSTSCLNNLRQIYTAIQTYRAQSGDLLPFTQP